MSAIVAKRSDRRPGLQGYRGFRKLDNWLRALNDLNSNDEGASSHTPSSYIKRALRWYTWTVGGPLWLTENHVPITVNSRNHWAFCDNHLSGNVMSLELVQKYNLTIEGTSLPFRMVDGSIEYSRGHVWVDCTLRKSPGSFKRQSFHVFTNPFRPLVLGVPFLVNTGIPRVTEGHSEPNTLLDSSQPSPTFPSPSSAGVRYVIKLEIGFLHEFVKTSALADTGSNTNLMSSAFVQQLNLPIVRAGHLRFAQMGNGNILLTRGAVNTSLRFSASEALHSKEMRCDFTVIDGLPFDVAIGAPLINNKQHFKKSDIIRQLQVIGGKDFAFFATNIADWQEPFVVGDYNDTPGKKDEKVEADARKKLLSKENDIKEDEKKLAKIRNDKKKLPVAPINPHPPRAVRKLETKEEKWEGKLAEDQKKRRTKEIVAKLAGDSAKAANKNYASVAADGVYRRPGSAATSQIFELYSDDDAD